MMLENAHLLVLLMVVICGPWTVVAQQWTERQNPYLKEVLMGRCYENPSVQQPERDALSCPFVVDSFMGVLDSHLDQDIGIPAFDMYLEMTDSSSPTDSSLFLWPPPSDHDATSIFSNLQPNLMLPETTPGGALLHGLVFCGTDRRLDCPAEYWNVNRNPKGAGVSGQGRGAQASFWSGLYAKFAAKAQGRVRMVILANDLDQIPPLWNDHVLPHLATTTTGSTSTTTVVDVIAADCEAPGVVALTNALQTVHHINSMCTNIISTQWSTGLPGLCQVADILDMDSTFTSSNTDNNSDSSNDHGKKSKTNQPAQVPTPVGPIDCDCPDNDSVYMLLFWGLVLFVAAGGYALWSVWHYMPEYHRIPNVGEEHELSSNPNHLPKQ